MIYIQTSHLRFKRCKDLNVRWNTFWVSLFWSSISFNFLAGTDFPSFFRKVSLITLSKSSWTNFRHILQSQWITGKEVCKGLRKRLKDCETKTTNGMQISAFVSLSTLAVLLYRSLFTRPFFWFISFKKHSLKFSICSRIRTSERLALSQRDSTCFFM